MPPHTVAHLALMASMVLLLVTAVVFARLKKRGWLARHRLLVAAGAGAGLAGVATMAIAKHLNGWPHAATLHSQVGASALGLVLAASVLGTLLAKGRAKGRAKLRQSHRTTGRLAVLASVTAAALGIAMVS